MSKVYGNILCKTVWWAIYKMKKLLVSLIHIIDYLMINFGEGRTICLFIPYEDAPGIRKFEGLHFPTWGGHVV